MDSRPSTKHVAIGQHWRHKKRGSVYEIVHDNASIQCASDPEVQKYEDEGWVAYRPVDGHSLYFRLIEEFTDGRFELVKGGRMTTNSKHAQSSVMLPTSMIALDSILNEPTPYEEETRVRDFRHSIWPRWQEVVRDVEAALRAASPQAQGEPEFSIVSLRHGAAERNGDDFPFVFIAIDQQRNFLGWVVVMIEPDGYLGIRNKPWVYGMYVEPTFRGRGIGRRLMQAVEEVCIEQGQPVLYLDTDQAAGFYERLGGWKTIGTDIWEKNGEALTIMEKWLGPSVQGEPQSSGAVSPLACARCGMYCCTHSIDERFPNAAQAATKSAPPNGHCSGNASERLQSNAGGGADALEAVRDALRQVHVLSLTPIGKSAPMTVYVDDVRHSFGRMVMCHMWADTLPELLAMADRIGVAQRWLQQPPKASWVHFDIALSKKDLAIAAGAVLTDKYGPVEHLARLRGDTAKLEQIAKARALP